MLAQRFSTIDAVVRLDNELFVIPFSDRLSLSHCSLFAQAFNESRLARNKKLCKKTGLFLVFYLMTSRQFDCVVKSKNRYFLIVTIGIKRHDAERRIGNCAPESNKNIEKTRLKKIEIKHTPMLNATSKQFSFLSFYCRLLWLLSPLFDKRIRN